MKLIRLLSLVLSFPLCVGAQVIPNTQTQAGTPTQTLNTVPAAYGSSILMSSIRIWEAARPMTVDTMISSASRTVAEVKQTNSYFDGLGRFIQQVEKGISPAGNDQVSAKVYDPLGREQYSYLPFVANNTGGNTSISDGNFKLNPFQEQAAFYSGNTPVNPVNGQGETFFYGQTVFETSPLNRPTSIYPAGNSWAGTAKGESRQYYTNTAADSVVIWNIGISGDSTPTSSGYYGAGQLQKNSTIDERGDQVVEYKDKDNRVVLKKAQLSASPATGPSGWLCTYYIFDDLGNLRYAIQPQGVVVLKAAGWIFDGTAWRTSSIAQGLCFSYLYDLRNRMVKKRLPGANEAWMVYDARDRLVMTQDSALRSQGKWLYTQYDSLDRPVITGIWATTGDIVYQQGLAAASVSYPNPISNFTVLTQTWYDSYTGVNANGSGLSTSLITTYTGNTSYFYTADNNNFPYPRSITATSQTKGMVTGTRVNVVNTTTYLYTVKYYDDRGRLIQVHSTNYSGGKDTVTTQYGFTGKPLRVLTGHGKAGTNTLSYSVLTKNFYDAAERLTAITKKVGTSAEDSIARYQYNELGQLSLREIGCTRTSLTNFAYTANPVDTMRYTYNIRGWLHGINKDYAAGVNGAVNWFGMELDYDYGFSQQQLNGNIAGTKWRNKGDGAQRAYGFSYDAANRLLKGDFTQYNSGAWNTSAGIDFSLSSINYDNNSNILNLTQKGLKLNTTQIIDSLFYGYNTNSNRLSYVTDKANDTSAHLGDFTEINNNTSPDYAYDGNGSLTQDNNKNISYIRYDHLHLPDSIAVTGKGAVSYVYDATGVKLQKITTETAANKRTVTTYLGSFIYQYTAVPTTGSGLDTLQFIQQEEGRIRPKKPVASDTMYYDYYEKDHLNNTRVVLTDEPEQDIYPAATLENNAASFNTQTAYYTINTADTMSVSRIASWGSTSGNNYLNNNGNPPFNNDPYANTSATSTVVYHLNGSTGDKTGLGVTLKVMSGDIVNIYGRSFWHNNTGSNPNNNYLITSILNTFIGGFAATGAITAVHGATASALEGSSVTSTGVTSWLQSVPNPATATVPRAYINWILFNDQFVPVASNSGFDLVNTAADAVKTHSQGVTIGTSGYLYVYCSNESNVDVYFDNLQVVDTRGPLLEVNNYYPFGLTMAGISDLAVKTKYPQNKYRYNGKELQNKEFSDGSGLEEYDYGARLYDPQIGRWHTVDNSGEKYYSYSPYNYALDNPANVIDPDGNDIYILVWYSKDGETGHSAIAVDNYKTVKKTDKDGKVIKDKDGKDETEQVKDGTFTFYDLWPEKPVGDRELKDDVKDDYHKKMVKSLDDLTKTNVSASGEKDKVSENGEGRAADGVVKLETTYEQDNAAKTKLDALEKSGKDYNACGNNCSTFVQNGIKAVFPNFDASQLVKPSGALRLLYKDASVVAPNNLYNSALQIKGSSNIKGPAHVEAKPYLEYFGKQNRQD